MSGVPCGTAKWVTAFAGDRPSFVKGEYVDFDDGETNADRDGHLWVVTSGLGYRVSDQTTIGLLTRYRSGEADSNALAASLDSEFWGGGAYLTTTLGGGLKLAVAGLYDAGDNDINIGGDTGRFDSEHVTVEGRLDRRFERGTFWIEPGVGIRYVDTQQDNYTDSAGTLVVNQDLTLGRLTYGPTIGTTIMRGDTTLRPFARINGVWDFENEGNFVTSTAGTFTSAARSRAHIPFDISAARNSPWAKSQEETRMDFTVNRLCPALGAEIAGLDVSRTPSGNLVGAIREALNEAGGVLVLRDQELTPEQHVDFSRCFGPLFGEAEQLQDTVKPYLHPDFPQIYRVSNKVVDGKTQGRVRAGTYWHSDVSFRKRPAMFSILHGIEVPPLGGDTLFTNMTMAWEALSDAMKELIAPLRAVHHFAGASNAAWSHETVAEDDLDGTNVAEHPVVRVHAETGQKSLFVNPGNTSHLVGFSDSESKALLGFLYEHAIRPEFQYRHRWRPRDLIMWDNRCTLHYAITDYTADRYMHRTTVIGEEPLAS